MRIVMKLLFGLGGEEKINITTRFILETAVILLLAFFGVIGLLLLLASKLI